MATSKLQEKVYWKVRNICPSGTEIKENFRPEWLISDRGTRLELDIYIPSIRLAIEVQGGQHYMYVPHFHKSYDRFKQQLKDDEYKKDYCTYHEIKFIEIASEGEMYVIDDFLYPLYFHQTKNETLLPIPYWRQEEKRVQEENSQKVRRQNRLQHRTRAVDKRPRLVIKYLQKIIKYSERLWQWYLGEIDESHPSLVGKRRFGALTNLFENLPYCYELVPLSMESSFIDFLYSKFPEDKYKEEIKNLYNVQGDVTNIFYESIIQWANEHYPE